MCLASPAALAPGCASGVADCERGAPLTGPLAASFDEDCLEKGKRSANSPMTVATAPAADRTPESHRDFPRRHWAIPDTRRYSPRARIPRMTTIGQNDKGGSRGRGLSVRERVSCLRAAASRRSMLAVVGSRYPGYEIQRMKMGCVYQNALWWPTWKAWNTTMS